MVTPWSDRAVAYRRAHPGTADPTMAVLIQRHIDADVAGVLFTGPSVRIEAAWGPGERVVHGLVTPDSWTVTPDGTLLRPTTDRPCLTDARVHHLSALGRTIEALLGTPVDVEWALAGNEFWILQARPVTVPPPEGPRQPPPSATPERSPSTATPAPSGSSRRSWRLMAALAAPGLQDPAPERRIDAPGTNSVLTTL